MWKMSPVERDPVLQRLADLAEQAIAAAAPGPEIKLAARRVFADLARRAGPAGAATAQRLPVCRHFAEAIAVAEAGPEPLPELARTLAQLEPRFAWRRRSNADPGTEPFYSGHANALIVGPGGLEDRPDVWIGASLMTPRLTYVDHDHPPEEVYLALTPGQWWNAAMDWTSPGAGGLIYNPPGILHNMRAADTPFLALWFLPVAAGATIVS